MEKKIQQEGRHPVGKEGKSRPKRKRKKGKENVEGKIQEVSVSSLRVKKQWKKGEESYAEWMQEDTMSDSEEERSACALRKQRKKKRVSDEDWTPSSKLNWDNVTFWERHTRSTCSHVRSHSSPVFSNTPTSTSTPLSRSVSRGSARRPATPSSSTPTGPPPKSDKFPSISGNGLKPITLKGLCFDFSLGI